jgi:outer membrane protein TolC
MERTFIMRRLIDHYARLGVALLATSGCIATKTREGYSQVLRTSDDLWKPKQSGSTAASSASADEAELARGARLSTLTRLALARNPAPREARERVRASTEQARAVGHLPDPELKYEQWAVPLDRPYALDRAGMLMLGVRQSFPAPGSLDAESRAALEEAKMVLEMQRARVRDLRVEVERAYFDYVRTAGERAIRLDHERTAARIVELARANYEVGRASQADVLRALLEQSRLHGELAQLDADERSARAMLNTLMARAPDAPLGPPVPEPIAAPDLKPDQLEHAMLQQRPELATTDRGVQRDQAALQAAKQNASWPSFTVGVDYWLMPTASNPNAYGAMVAMSLPWLNPQHEDRVRAAEHTLEADRIALASARLAARYELANALNRYRAAGALLAIFDRELLGQAEQSYEAAQAAFATGRGDARSVLDALRAYLDLRLEQTRALARTQSALAEVKRVVGTELWDVAPTGAGARP